MSRSILSVAVFVLSAAVTAQSTYDAKILEYTGLRYTCEGQGTPVLKIQNAGSATMGTCVVETWKNGLMVNSFNWILAVPALTGDVRQPALPAVPAMSPGDQLEFHIISVNGEPDEDPLGNILTVDMNEVPAFSNGGEMEVRVELGDDPGSIVWSVTNHLNQVVASGGPYDEANTVVTDELDLPAGCYTFKSEDASRSVAPDAVVTVRRDANTLIVAADLSTPFRKGLRAGAPQACANQLTLELLTDSQGSETVWEILDMTTQDVVCTGGPYANAAQLYTEDCCLPDGCYRLVVTDGAGDGITGGGYLLRIANGARLIDNRLDQFGNGGYATGFTSAIAGSEGICLPLGTDRLIHTSCDKLDWRTSPCSAEFIVANENAALSAEWLPNMPNSAQSATTGYQFWFFDPNGGYSFKRFRSHRVSEGYTWSDANGNPTPWTRAAHCLLNNWAAGNHLQQGVLYNVRVRSRLDGVYGAFGP
ncbi:MAG TPA: hypothetical protein PKY96_12765, partial [Flavobacteriales bacterium]|nr:hypothetical protein [Flavobacteriales bacterium]